MTPLHSPQDLAQRLKEGDTTLAAFLFEHAGMRWDSQLTRTTLYGRGDASVLGLALEAPTPVLLDFLRTSTQAPSFEKLAHTLGFASTDPMTGGPGESRDTKTAAHLAFSGLRLDALVWVLDAHQAIEREETLKNAQDARSDSSLLRWLGREHLTAARWLNAWASSWGAGAPLEMGQMLHERLGMRAADWLAVEVGDLHGRRSGRWFQGPSGNCLPFAMAWSIVAPGKETVSWLVDAAGVDPNARAGWEGTPQASWLEVAALNQSWDTVAALRKHGADWSGKTEHLVREAHAVLTHDLQRQRIDEAMLPIWQAERATLDALLLDTHIPQKASGQHKRARM